ncbi:helix-turn-helix domain-containing protein [Streptococcus pneumoniae]
MSFGDLVRKCRLDRGWTKEDLCGDESQLSVRQLTRLESGASKPTLAKIEFLASRLGIPTYQLMTDYVDLPQEYLDKKYVALRWASFGDRKKLDEIVLAIEDIAEQFYEILPEDERVMIWLLRCRMKMCKEQIVGERTPIFDDYFEQVKRRDWYSINDLLLLQVYFLACQLQSSLFEVSLYTHIVDRVIEQEEHIPVKDWFLLRDLIIAILTAGLEFQVEYKAKELVKTLERMMDMTQDYQKKVIVDLLKWKVALFMEQAESEAKKSYHEAYHFAKQLGDDYLLKQIEQEWEQDWKLFS